MIIQKNKSVVLFDGICNLCNGSVLFIIKNDKKERFKFASLQSDVAKEILLQCNFKKNENKSLILIENKKIYTKSSAVLKIAKNLDGILPMFYLFAIIPKPIRDWLYDIISKNRYKWFGKRELCFVASDKIKKRFL